MEEYDEEDLETLLDRARQEEDMRRRAILWGICILYVLSLEDIQEGLTFEKIGAMSDLEAGSLANQMQAVFEMRSPPAFLKNEGAVDATSVSDIQPKDDNADTSEIEMSNRRPWPKKVADNVLTDCHHRCCMCPDHRRVANIHHIDGDNSNSVEDNAVGLCGECHPDVHTTSTMRRNITEDQVRIYKREWTEKCRNIDSFLRTNVSEFRGMYYVNVHRLDALYREYGKPSFLPNIPHQYPAQDGHYNTLWGNPKNSLDWIKLAENRAFYEECLCELTPKLTMFDINLFEVRAIDAEDKIGSLVGFSCQFIGQDIPMQSELTAGNGEYIGPPPTMRREVVDAIETESVTETCMILDSTYMFADSSFIHFSEHGIWNGFGRIMKCRNAVGSNDGHLLRRQIVVSPICIGTPPDHLRQSRIPPDAQDADSQHKTLVDRVA